jgi:hypothetical protein
VVSVSPSPGIWENMYCPSLQSTEEVTMWILRGGQKRPHSFYLILLEYFLWVKCLSCRILIILRLHHAEGSIVTLLGSLSGPKLPVKTPGRWVKLSWTIQVYPFTCWVSMRIRRISQSSTSRILDLQNLWDIKWLLFLSYWVSKYFIM